MNDDLGHGHSIASWTGVGVLILGATLVSLGVFFGWAWASWTGVGVCIAGVLAWVGLNAAGYGGPVSHASNDDTSRETVSERTTSEPVGEGHSTPGDTGR